MTELHRLFMNKQEQEYNDKAFAASLKGVKMDPWVDPDEKESGESVEQKFDRIKHRAAVRAAIANGDLPEDYKEPKTDYLEGFGFESEDD